MYRSARKLVFVPFATLLISACSGPQEDPRIAFCRGMAADLTGSDVAEWAHADNRIVEPEYAEVRIQRGSDTASCWYEYDADESGAMELANPLLAFTTLPYQVKVGNEILRGPQLTEAVKRQQVAFGQAVVERTQDGLQNAVDNVRDAVEQVRQP